MNKAQPQSLEDKEKQYVKIKNKKNKNLFKAAVYQLNFLAGKFGRSFQ